VIAAQRHYFADGAFYMFSILAKESYLVVDGQRLVPPLIRQSLAVAAIKLGVSDVGVVSALFGLGLYLHYIISFLICVRITQNEHAHLLIFPLLSYIASTFCGSSDIVSEAHFLASLFWPLMLYAYVNITLTRLDYIGIAVLAALTIKTYASAAVLVPIIMAGIAYHKLLKGRITNRQRLFWLACLLILAVSVYAGLDALLDPRSAQNKEKAMGALWRLRFYLPVLFSFLVCGAALAVLLLKGLPRKVYSGLYIVIGASGIALLLMALLEPRHINMYGDFSARVLLLYVPFGLGIIAATVMTLRLSPGAEATTAARNIAYIGIAFHLVWHVNVTWQWQGFTDLFEEEISSHQGIVPLAASRLSREQIGHQTVKQMGWSWTYPFMSVLLAKDGNVQSIIGPKRSGDFRVGFPDNPPDLSRYGIHYTYLNKQSAVPDD
jgi:hypothetical protein